MWPQIRLWCLFLVKWKIGSHSVPNSKRFCVFVSQSTWNQIMKLLQVLTQDTHWPVFPSVFPGGFLMNPEPNADTLFLQTSGWGRSQAKEIGTWASSSFFSGGVEMAQKGICCKGRLSLIVVNHVGAWSCRWLLISFCHCQVRPENPGRCSRVVGMWAWTPCWFLKPCFMGLPGV